MKLKALLGSVIALVAMSQVACAESTTTASVKEGSDYTVISGKEASAKPHVYEFFSYTCPHCYNLEPVLNKWKENSKPEAVKFEQVPVFMSQVPHLTYGYYVAEVLGVKEKVHPAIFHQWHAEKNIIRTKEDLIPIFEEAGVSKEDFEKAYTSFGVESKVQYAQKLARDFKVIRFPMIIVNKKYKVESYNNINEMLGSFAIENTK
ncbi:thiol:disulfide interchange protein DsbA/DsbL [Kangiella taiwanensis]|uniref:Thiol:disulfide interchange protein n=1 Tax=Kangiella taiwanensis TaxID=1079179 RepID=A0ABP8HX20_9GAMM|nr:thiol:disulfide interchange protein DsbA/DsbL [Kangiella taiwanensis]